MNQPEITPEFEALLAYLKQSRNFDFTGYKPSSLIRRISKRLQTINVQGYSNYIDYLEVHPDEFNYLFDTILINVTAFFRDAEAWEYLRQEIIPQIVQDKPFSQPIRIWSAGCASGEETYTLAIILAEVLGREQFRERVKIFATDLDNDALNQARHGTYSERQVQGISPDLLEKYFEQDTSGYTFNKDLRRSLIFGRHNLIQDAPISRIDLLVCRNILMYFNSETQTKILNRFHFALNPKGFTFLGKAEMLFSRSNLFTPVDLKQRVFAKVEGRLCDLLPSRVKGGSSSETAQSMYEQQIYEAAFDADPVAQVVIDLDGFLRHANQRSRLLFNLSHRDLNRPFQDLEFSYRPVELRSPIALACSEQRVISLQNVKWSVASYPEPQYFDIQVMPLLASSKLLGVKVVFLDVTLTYQLQQQLQHSNQELETAYEELQSTNEELETTNEELQSANEELETTNEELQSTNEELETMNEELQSTNEELQTINVEMRLRGITLDRANAFQLSILSSLSSGVIVLTPALLIEAWSAKAEDLWGLRSDEVQGKPFLNLDIGLPVEQVLPLLRAGLAGEVKSSEMTLDAINRRGKAIRCKVTCTSLIDSTAQIQGAILLMVEQEST